MTFEIPPSLAWMAGKFRSSANSAGDWKWMRRDGPVFKSLVTPPVMPPHPRIHTVADAGASIYSPPSRLGYEWVHYRPVTLTRQIVPAIPAICLSATPPAVGGFTLMGSSAGRKCIKSDHEV